MNRDALLAEAMRLISIPSHEDCTAVLTYIEQRLPFLAWQRQPVAKWVNGRQQFNLHALDPARPFVVNTHVDTVPPLTMRSAFSPRLEGERLYGRGAVDTKGLLAALIVALEAFYHEHGQVPVSVALTVDEESNEAVGSQALAPLLEPMRAVLVLEPTGGAICTGQVGTLEFTLEAHAQGVYHAARYEETTNPIRLLVQAWMALEDAVGRPLNVFLLEGGWEHYATPSHARLRGEFVLPHGWHWQDVEERIRQTLDREPFTGRVLYQRIDQEDPMDFGHHWGTEQLARAYQEALGEDPRWDIMPGWTDAANFAHAGKDCVVFGFGDLAVAHSEREYITVADMERTARVLYRLFTILTQ